MTTGVTPHQNGAPGRDCAAPAALREDQEGPELPEKLPRELDDGHGDGRDTDEEDMAMGGGGEDKRPLSFADPSAAFPAGTPVSERHARADERRAGRGGNVGEKQKQVLKMAEAFTKKVETIKAIATGKPMPSELDPEQQLDGSIEQPPQDGAAAATTETDTLTDTTNEEVMCDEGRQVPGVAVPCAEDTGQPKSTLPAAAGPSLMNALKRQRTPSPVFTQRTPSPNALS